MPFESYLVDAVNRIHDLRIQARLHPDEEDQKLLEASIIGCQTLSRLLDDQSFARTLKELSEARHDLQEHGPNYDQFRILLEAEDSFENFLKVEYEVMLKGGLFPDIAESLIKNSREAVKRVRERTVPVSAVIEATRRLRDEACHMENELRGKANTGRVWERWRRRMRRVAEGLGGGALIGINCVSLPATGPLAILSGEIGTAIIIDAIIPAH